MTSGSSTKSVFGTDCYVDFEQGVYEKHLESAEQEIATKLNQQLSDASLLYFKFANKRAYLNISRLCTII